MSSNKDISIELLLKELQETKNSLKIIEGKVECLVHEEKEGIFLPVSIFDSKLSPFEVIAKYLKEALGKKFSEIAALTGRDSRTVWGAYARAQKKNIDLKIIESEYEIPLSIFKNRKLSSLENISVYLHEKIGLGFSKIASLIGKDPRTIWTCYDRAKKKVSSDR